MQVAERIGRIGGKYEYGFYFVVAPDIDKQNKFYWK